MTYGMTGNVTNLTAIQETWTLNKEKAKPKNVVRKLKETNKACSRITVCRQIDWMFSVEKDAQAKWIGKQNIYWNLIFKGSKLYTNIC